MKNRKFNGRKCILVLTPVIILQFIAIISMAQQGTISFDPTKIDTCRDVCYGSETTTIYGDEIYSANYTWYYSVDSTLTWLLIPEATFKDYDANHGNYYPKDSVFFKRGHKVGTSNIVFSNTVLLKIFSQSKGGTILSTFTSVCQYDDKPLAWDTGYIGEILGWEVSHNNSEFWMVSNSANKDSLYLPTDSSLSFFYRMVVKSGPCPESYSDTITFTVKPKPVGKADPTSRTLCEGTDFEISLSNTGGLPATYQWTRDQTSLVLGIAASGEGNKISGTPVFQNPHPSPETIQFSCVAIADGCHSDTFNAFLTVKGVPTAIAIPGELSVCSGDSAIISLTSSFGSLTVSYYWTKDNQFSVTGFPSEGTSNIIRGKPVLLIPDGTSQQVIFRCTATYDICPSKETIARVNTKPFPVSRSISGEFNDVCQQAKPYQIELHQGETVHWKISNPQAGEVIDPDLPSTVVHWAREGEYSLIATVSRSGCPDSFSEVVSVNSYEDPADHLVKKAHPSADTLVIVCQEHINENSKNFLFTWGYERKTTGETTILATNTFQSYWAFPNPDTDVFRYFADIAYKAKSSCSGRTYYQPAMQLNIPEHSSCKVFPNPFRNNFYLTVEDPSTGPFTMTIQDLTGRTIWQETLYKELPVQTFHGIFNPQKSSVFLVLLRFENGNTMTTKMMVY